MLIKAVLGDIFSDSVGYQTVDWQACIQPFADKSRRKAVKRIDSE